MAWQDILVYHVDPQMGVAPSAAASAASSGPSAAMRQAMRVRERKALGTLIFLDKMCSSAVFAERARALTAWRQMYIVCSCHIKC